MNKRLKTSLIQTKVGHSLLVNSVPYIIKNSDIRYYEAQFESKGITYWVLIEQIDEEQWNWGFDRIGDVKGQGREVYDTVFRILLDFLKTYPICNVCIMSSDHFKLNIYEQKVQEIIPELVDLGVGGVFKIGDIIHIKPRTFEHEGNWIDWRSRE